jgi:hypothetical protein
MRLQWKLAIVAVPLLLLGGVVLRRGVTERPMKEGNSADFWHSACQVQVDPTRTSRCQGETWRPRDGWCVYADKHGDGIYIHGASECRVEERKAFADFPAVVQALAAGEHLEEQHPLRGRIIEEGYRVWLAANPGQDDPHLLLASIRSAWFAHWRKLDQSRPGSSYSAYQDRLAEEKDFDERWEQSKRWHVNVIGELVYLSVLLLFAAWPWLGNASPWWWGLHFALLPLLFFLPYWLGYGPLAFTSAGPQGGPLYPNLIAPFRGLPWTELDSWVLRRSPFILAPYSQRPGPLLALTGLGGVGLVAALGMGAMLGLSAYAFRNVLCSGGRDSPPVRFLRRPVGSFRQHP